MKWFSKLFVAALLATTLNGCIEMHTIMRLNKDGSGSIEENISVRKGVIDMFKEFVSAFADSTQPQQEFNLFEEEKIKAKTSGLGEGVEFVSMETIKTSETEGYKAIYKFKDVNKVKLNQDPSNELPMGEPTEETEKQKEEVLLKFTQGKPSRIEFNFPDEVKKTDDKHIDNTFETEEKDAEADSANFEQMVKFLKDMKARIDIQVEGNITNTNASYVDGNTITLFDIDFDKLISDENKLEQFKKANPDSFEEVKKLVKDIPGIRVEMNKVVFIEFE